MLQVKLLGRPQITVDGSTVDLPRRKNRAVLYYLATHGKPLTRDQLQAMFWPDYDRPAAQQTLRVALYGLRQTLGHALVVERDTLSLAADVEVDVRSFEGQLSPPTSDLELLAATLDLYRGDFLEGITLPDNPEFDDWVVAQAERYRRLAIRGLSALADLQERRGNFAEAMRSLDRALAFEPLQEDLQRARMRLLYLSGDRTGAIRLYESLRKLLKEEMGVPPMAETRSMYDAIINDTLSFGTVRKAGRDGPARAKQSSADTPRTDGDLLPFAGREAQMKMLRASTTSQARKLIVIEGEPGIGKTRLVDEFIRQSNAIAIVGVAHELELALPYQPIIEGLRGLMARTDWPALEAGLRASLPSVWRSEIGRLIPELGVSFSPSTYQRSTRGAEESRLWEGINQFLIALSQQKQVIVFIDDLHWAEASTLGVLGYLVRQTGDAPVLLLAATRPFGPRSTVATLVQTLTREERVTRLGLPRLGQDDIAAIAGSLSPTYLWPLANWLLQTSEGNPYILAELVRYARENSLLMANGTLNLDALSTSAVVPHSVYSLVQSRLQRLSDPARRILDALVAVGREFDFDLAARVAGISESGALDAIEELTAAGILIQIDGTSYRFDHSLTMEVAYREVSEARHRLLHRRVAEELEILHQGRLESVAELLSWHFTEGNVPDRAATYAFQAGQKALRIDAWSEAATFFERSLQGCSPSLRLPSFMGLGDARQKAGHAAQATEAYREALALAEKDDDTAAIDAARLALAYTMLQQARYTESLDLAQQVREHGRPDSAVNAEFLWGTALSLEGADLAEANDHLKSAESLCATQTPVDLAQLAQIKFALGSVAAQKGDLAQAIDLYRQTLEIASQYGDTDALASEIALADNNLAYHLHLLNDPSAIDYAKAGLNLARDKGLLWLETYLLSTLGEIALARDDLEMAEKQFAEGLAMAERLSIPERVAGLTANLGLVAAKQEKTNLAIHRLSTALARADGLGARHLSAQIRLWLVPLLPLSEARAYLMEARSIAESSGRQRLLEEARRLEEQMPAT